jgi:Glyoxalase-like domain
VTLQVDHLVVAAASLDQGVAWCEATLGVTPGPGGRHPLMGTHNRLLKIATAAFPDAYLEIIAVDPAAPPPGRARWFGLDDAGLQVRLQATPRFIHVVARTGTLGADRQALLGAGLDPGVPVSAGRDTPQGPLAWQIVVRDDGALLLGGALPTLIEWQGRHPAQAMADSGVTLRALQWAGLPPPASTVLKLHAVTAGAGAAPAWRAVLDTPRGEVVLSSQ